MTFWEKARPVAAAIAGSMLLLLTGCASIVSGTTQVVSVDTPGCPGATCEMTNEKGKWYLARTPGTVSVSRAYGPMAVSCKLNDASGDATFQSSTKGMAFGNILFGGVIGAGIDMGSGAAYDYPQTFSVPMVCTAPTAQAAPAPSLAAAVARSPLKLGIRGESVTEAIALASGLDGRQGVFITAVDDGSVGHRVGLKSNQILLEFNGKAITNIDFLAQLLAATEDRAAFELLVFEGGRRFKVARPGSSL